MHRASVMRRSPRWDDGRPGKSEDAKRAFEKRQGVAMAMFYLFEGGNGTGKSTISKIVAERIGARYLSTPPAQYETFREYMDTQASPLAVFLFYMAGNIEVSEKIKAALRDGPVVCDRYVPSTMASLMVRVAISLAEARRLVGPLETYLVSPDLTVLVTVSHQERIKRIASRGKPLSVRDVDEQYNRNVDNTFLELAQEDAWVIVDTTNQTVEQTVAQVLSLITEHPPTA